ncbi:YlmC/YmxH family sporulation protein [Desnuesiella massiliensis]|uniref:YlmC/YmxH family sporulation protein n=1 Tax=Desnuesiella massiliensis TaxID=1650662 RepID=UPI0006E350FC|nr:YlmC/YmxH family sporulation protein [Desnuesiella massiliensis]
MESLHSVNNIKMMEVIDVNMGAKLGFIKDIKIDCDNYKILSILIPVQKNSWFSKLDMLEIPWDKVVKIGVDVILVDSDSSFSDNM